jgi:uncharacterized protein YbjT (DUF2867 family)
MTSDERRVLVTGANGQIGLQLLAQLDKLGLRARALVRSERAAGILETIPETLRPEVQIADPRDPQALGQAAEGCDMAVHLIGILKESETTSYHDAHEATCRALARAGAERGLERIVYLSIFGADPGSQNECLASKGRAEEILCAGKVPASVLRIPMVIGADDPASRALRAQARKSWLPLVGGGTTLHQPLDARDLLCAILACLDDSSGTTSRFDLGGPECLSQRDLVRRAAALYGNTPRFVTIPRTVVRSLAAVLEKTSANPPVTRAMLGVLEHDDRIDSREALAALALQLTPLDETLQRFIGPEASQG